MDMILVGVCMAVVVTMYFRNNPLHHTRRFMIRRFINWFPLGMTYAFLYMARYNLNVSKNALGNLMNKEDFGIIFGIGTFVYGLSFLVNGPLVDRIGGKKGILIASLGSSLANGLMGILTYLFLHGAININLTIAFSILYAINMFFQSYGAVSIIKVKAYWFHVRERGVFGAIFGTLISFGVYFAFDWGQAIVDASKLKIAGEMTWFQKTIQSVFAIQNNVTDATWLVFFIPSFILILWALIDMVVLKDTPDEAGFDEFDPHDASSDEPHMDLTMGLLLKKIFTNPIMLTIALIEFTSGVIRNGIIQWYFIFAKEVPQIGAEFFLKHWGLLLCMSGIVGGFASGLISDKLFHSRRGPAAALMNGVMIVSTIVMSVILYSSPVGLGVVALVISAAVIGVHSIMSGTAAADFGGRKNTATASGIVDGCVYLGSGLQSVALGYLTTQNWQFWPIFLVPFTVLGLVFSVKMWQALPEATKKYLLKFEKMRITQVGGRTIIVKETDTVTVDTDEPLKLDQ